MAFSPNTLDREHDKFVESPTRPGKTAIEIVGEISASPNPFSPPPSCDFILRSVSGSVETFEYFNGGSGGTLLKTVAVTYSGPDLEDLVSVEVS
jgi:hypothetical protein